MQFCLHRETMLDLTEGLLVVDAFVSSGSDDVDARVWVALLLVDRKESDPLTVG